MALAEKTEADAAAWKETRRLVLAANHADPNDTKPLILFYESFGAQGQTPTHNAVEGLLQAFALAPHEGELRMNPARQYLVNGKVAEARRALAPLAYDPHGGERGQAIATVIAQLESGTKAALDAWEAAQKASGKADKEGKKKG